MTFEFTSLRPQQTAGFDTVIDVRSPAEFAEDHIPGAINLPAFSDEERALVGTLYVQDSPFKARKTGAALLARNVAHHLETALADKDGSWKPLVYCWRGGQRSGGVSTILQQIGWRAARVSGGYQAYRRQVVAMLYKDPLPWRVVLLDGNTGSGKTAVLHELSMRGVQVLDLEGLAAHKGSVLGATAQPQPSQKMFESRLAQGLGRFDPSRPVVIEAESSKVGARLVPSALWKAMKAAPRIEISVPVTARAAFLTQDYASVLAAPGEMAKRLESLRALCGHAKIALWHDMLLRGDHETLAADLMNVHYDPGYMRSRAKRDARILGQATADTLDSAGISALTDQVISVLHEMDARS